jgi:hypothetical protein
VKTYTNYRLAAASSSLLVYCGVFLLIPVLVEDEAFLYRFLWQYNFFLILAGFLILV